MTRQLTNPIPNNNNILKKLGICQYFSTLNLASGFHQIQMAKEDVQQTVFNVENCPNEFLRMQFGHKMLQLPFGVLLTMY